MLKCADMYVYTAHHIYSVVNACGNEREAQYALEKVWKSA